MRQKEPPRAALQGKEKRPDGDAPNGRRKSTDLLFFSLPRFIADRNLCVVKATDVSKEEKQMTFAGTWDCIIATQIGNQPVQLRIKDDAGTITGEAAGVEVVQFIDPTVSGDRLTWSQKITKPVPMTIKFEISIQGDDLAGIAKPGFFPPCKVTGKRIAA
jgi:hypothetical protein